MSIIPWSNRNVSTPERFRQFQDEVNDMFTNMFRGLPMLSWGNGSETGWVPAINVKDDEKSVTLTAELPGVKREDVKIEVTGDRLILRGEKHEEKSEKKDNWWRKEATYGAFMRQVALPTDVESDRAEAKMENGVLTVRIPKATTSKSKSIKVG
jgi:HSP20 family protein